MKSTKISSMMLATYLMFLFSHMINKIHAGGEILFDTMKDPCSPGDTGIYLHRECQLYYNCSNPTQFATIWPHLQECTYPDLFNADSLSCETYKNVDCKDTGREEIKHACDYKQNQCFRGHCRPCQYTWPKCEIENGKTEFQAMLGSPHFGVCQDGRVVERSVCKDNMSFNADTKTCEQSN